MPVRSSSGRHTPEVIGDYVGGSNHVLPTARSARFSSGLSVLDFIKRTLACLQARRRPVARGWRRPPIALARAEGLEAHAAVGRDAAELRTGP